MNRLTAMCVRANDAVHERLREILPAKRRIEKLLRPITPTMELQQVLATETVGVNTYARHVEITQQGGPNQIVCDITVDWIAKTAEAIAKVNGVNDVRFFEETLANGYRAILHYYNHPEHDVTVESVATNPADLNVVPNTETQMSLTVTKGATVVTGSFAIGNAYPDVYEHVNTDISHPATSLSLFFNPSIVGAVLGRAAAGDIPAELYDTRKYLCVGLALALDLLHCNFACTGLYAALNAIILMPD